MLRELKNHSFVRSVESYHGYAATFLVSFILMGKAMGYAFAQRFVVMSHQTWRNKDGVDHEHWGIGSGDTCFVMFLVSFITVLRLLYRKLVLERLAQRLSLKNSEAVKFCDAGWFGAYYVVATIWGYFIFRDDEWWFNTPKLWQGYPHILDFDTKLYYLVSLAFWVQCFFSFWFEPPRRDDVAFLVHHCVTIGLIGFSYTFGLFRVGAAILLNQNVADVLYYNAKLFKYAKFELISTITWVSFVVVWFVTRHIIFGYLLYSCIVEGYLYIPYVDAIGTTPDYYWTMPVHVGFVIGLSILKVLMFIWFFMILKVAIRVLKNFKQSDIVDTTDLSDSEDMDEKQQKSHRNPMLLANGTFVKREKSA